MCGLHIEPHGLYRTKRNIAGRLGIPRSWATRAGVAAMAGWLAVLPSALQAEGEPSAGAAASVKGSSAAPVADANAKPAVGTAKGASALLRWESAGVRVGCSLSSFSDPFLQSEIYSAWEVPWECDVGKQWRFMPKLEMSLGGLTGHGESGFVGTLGPVVVLRPKDAPVYLEGGFRPTVLSREVFGDRDLGSHFQFTSHLGLGWDLSDRWTLSYRFQHTSNAGLGHANPGLNMNLVGLGYRF